MRAITFQGRCHVVCESVSEPRIESDGDAIVRVQLAGLCGSDMHPYHERERGLDHGTVMGHEFVGEVVDVGDGVAGLRPGTVVVGPFTTSCGECYFCRSGLTARCVAGALFGWVSGGVGLQGAQAEFMRVPLAETTLVPVPDGVPAERALLTGDILATGTYCAERAEVDGRGTYVVVGCGPVGIMTIAAARHRGAERVLAFDRVAERLALAREAGAIAYDVDGGDPAAVVLEATSGRGADAVMEAVGAAGAERLAYELVRPGGIVSVVGVHTDPGFSFTPSEAYDKNLTYRSGRCPARHYTPGLLAALLDGSLTFPDVISHRMPLDEGARAYEIFDRKLDGCTKVVLIP